LRGKPQRAVGGVAQTVRAGVSYALGQRFDSSRRHPIFSSIDSPACEIHETFGRGRVTELLLNRPASISFVSRSSVTPLTSRPSRVTFRRIAPSSRGSSRCSSSRHRREQAGRASSHLRQPRRLVRRDPGSHPWQGQGARERLLSAACRQQAQAGSQALVVW
jgi:hypothetical protein